jgi:hypothetical protein
VSKIHLLRCAAYNLGLLLRKIWGMSKPRSRDAGPKGRLFLNFDLITVLCTIAQPDRRRVRFLFLHLISLKLLTPLVHWDTEFCWRTGFRPVF